MGKIEISPTAPEGKPPYAHLDPIVDALLSGGNVLANKRRWVETKDGWLCVLKEPIDFQLVRNSFVLPKTIELFEKIGSVSCSLTWSAIIESPPLEVSRR